MQQVVTIFFMVGVCLFVYFYLQKKNKHDTKKMRELMRNFAEQMVQENQKFLQHIGDLNIQLEAKIENTAQKMAELEQMVLSYEAIVIGSLRMRPEDEIKDEFTSDQREISQDILRLHDRYQEVFQLYSQGTSLEEISRTLGYGKGELELILQLAGEK